VTIIPEVKTALDAFSAAGLMAAGQDYERGGMQLPCVVDKALAAYFTAANVATSAYTFLTIGNANTLLKCATPRQVAPLCRRCWRALLRHHVFVRAAGRLQPVGHHHPRRARSAPGPEGERQYRLSGNKMWISAGEHELAENIVHLVLAKIPGPDGKLIPA
jgi:alkylation response protein AidB-like acyl-CoA dehydrogenase